MSSRRHSLWLRAPYGGSDPAKGFGFVAPDDGSRDAFVHISAAERAGPSSLSEEQKVSHELQPGQNGKSSAEKLSIIDEPRKAPPATPVRGRPPRAVADLAHQPAGRNRPRCGLKVPARDVSNRS